MFHNSEFRKIQSVRKLRFYFVGQNLGTILNTISSEMIFAREVFKWDVLDKSHIAYTQALDQLVTAGHEGHRDSSLSR